MAVFTDRVGKGVISKFGNTEIIDATSVEFEIKIAILAHSQTESKSWQSQSNFPSQLSLAHACWQTA